MPRNEIVRILLTTGLAWVFGIFGFDKFIHPLIWIGWMPHFFDGLLGISINTWLMVFGTLEIIFAVMIGIQNTKIRRIGALLMSLHLLGILAFMVPTQGLFNDIATRDIGLLFMALAAIAL